MTFDEWFKENQPGYFKSTQEFESYLKDVWNGSLEAARAGVDQYHWYLEKPGDDLDFIINSLKA